MSRIKGITIELDGDTRKLNSALTDVNKSVKQSQNELKQVERLLKFNPKNTELLAQKQKVLTETIEGTRKKLDALKQAQSQVEEQFKRGEISEEQYRKFQREIVETESKLKHYEKQLKQVDKSQKSFAERMADSGKKIKEVGQKMQSVGKNLSMYVTAPLTALGAIAGKIGMDFEAGLSEVQAITGATAKEIGQLEVKARELGASTKFSASEVTQGFKYMAMAGWDVKQSIEAIDGVLALAAASGEDLALVSDIVTDGMTAFGLAADQASRFSDVLASASSNANTNVAMLGESFKYVAPVAGALGYSIEDTALALGLMANAGIKSSQAGTALRGSLTNLVKPTDAMESKMKELGITIKDSNGEMKPLNVLLQDLRRSFATLTEDQKASAAATIFGKEAMAGMLAVINASEEDFNKLSKSINESEGAAQKMADTMQDNLKGKLTNLKSALEELAIKVFKQLEPAFKNAVSFVQGFVDKLNNMSPTMQKTVVAIGALVAALGPLLTIGGTILVGVGHFMTLLPTLIPLISAIAPPILVVVGALTALGTAYALTRQKADEALQIEKELAEHNLELAKSQEEVVDGVKKSQDATSEAIDKNLEYANTIDGLISSYERLSEKNKLTNEELGEYLTLQTELEHTTSPEKIAEMSARMEELQKKSGLSKEEFNELLSSNKRLTEYFPSAGVAVDEYGNKIVEVTGNLKELSKVELERANRDIYNKMIDDLSEVGRLIGDYERNQLRIYEIEDNLQKKLEERRSLEKEVSELTKERESNESKILDLKTKMQDASLLEKMSLRDQIGLLESNNMELDRKLKKYDKNLTVLNETIGVEEEELSTLQTINGEITTTITKNQTNYDKLLQVKSAQLDINLERGNENKLIDETIKKHQEEIKKLEDKIKKEGDSNGELQKQIDKRKTQIGQLETTKSELDGIKGTLDKQSNKHDDINGKIKEANAAFVEQGEYQNANNSKAETFKKKLEEQNKKAKELNEKLDEDHEKKIEIKQSKDPDEENRKWSSPITKIISFITKGKSPEGYAKGTDYHPGGPAFVGEEGPELAKINGQMQLLKFGLYDLPRGTKVYTSDETKQMLSGKESAQSNYEGAQININGPVYMRSDQDVKMLARELDHLAKQRKRGGGIR